MKKFFLLPAVTMAICLGSGYATADMLDDLLEKSAEQQKELEQRNGE